MILFFLIIFFDDRFCLKYNNILDDYIIFFWINVYDEGEKDIYNICK